MFLPVLSFVVFLCFPLPLVVMSVYYLCSLCCLGLELGGDGGAPDHSTHVRGIPLITPPATNYSRRFPAPYKPGLSFLSSPNRPLTLRGIVPRLTKYPLGFPTVWLISDKFLVQIPCCSVPVPCCPVMSRSLLATSAQLQSTCLVGPLQSHPSL